MNNQINDIDKNKIIEVIKSKPDKITVNLLKLKLHIGLITANKIIEQLLKEGIIEKCKTEGYKLCKKYE